VTVVMPVLATCHPWQEPLHNQLEYALALLGRPDVVVTSGVDTGGRLSGPPSGSAELGRLHDQ
jgi:hypothetical protein